MHSPSLLNRNLSPQYYEKDDYSSRPPTGDLCVISDSFVNDQSFLQSLQVNNLKKFNHDAHFKTGHRKVTNFLVSQKKSGVGPSLVYATQLAG
jgi:hypothetical protein